MVFIPLGVASSMPCYSQGIKFYFVFTTQTMTGFWLIGISRGWKYAALLCHPIMSPATPWLTPRFCGKLSRYTNGLINASYPATSRSRTVAAAFVGMASTHNTTMGTCCCIDYCHSEYTTGA